MRHCACLLLLLLLPVPGVLAQHSTAFDVISGEQAYQNYCANCHGVTGNLIANVDLGHGNFRQPYTDDDLLRIVMSGIDGTPMPGNPNMSLEQAREVVAYLRSRSNHEDVTAQGNAERGRLLYSGKGQCASCHRIAGTGGRLGPELTRIGLLRSSEQLLRSLLEPAEEVQANHRFYAVTTDDGQVVTGRLLNHDAFTVQLLDTDEQLRSFMKDDLQDYAFTQTPMPSLRDSFTAAELADLVQYLGSLRGALQ